ncbi:hypothetical protein SAMN05216236_15127 [Sedimentitalea nanhaiensis]|uniref:Uncharacterized protein n=1 Tax=Sedimentitalea nanhaiensis TaxID=999627 RepID=A0A1I7E945_9RHOB|nr:hypothetical protein SAMN05216236_15127 [Sedimentitalea nanhaiensis]
MAALVDAAIVARFWHAQRNERERRNAKKPRGDAGVINCDSPGFTTAVTESRALRSVF